MRNEGSVSARMEGSSSKRVASTQGAECDLLWSTQQHGTKVCVGYRTAAPDSVDCHMSVTAGLIGYTGRVR